LPFQGETAEGYVNEVTGEPAIGYILRQHISVSTLFSFVLKILEKNKGVVALRFYHWPAAKTGGVIKVVRQKYIQVSNSKYYLCQKVFPKVNIYSLAADF
jgi:hypothetical protein